MRKVSGLRWGLLCLLWAGVAGAGEGAAYRLVQKHPHDAAVFTQGLTLHDGWLYESGGLYDASTVRRMRPGALEATVVDLPGHLFAEGLTVLNDTLYLLTWENRRLLVYDAETLTLQRTRGYRGEGWGLTDDGTFLIMSNGSDTLLWRDPASLAVHRRVRVRENGQPLASLNELEWTEQGVWANVWRENRIVLIDPDSGDVQRSLDLSALVRAENPTAPVDDERVLNGIARDPATGHLWVTGKRWQWLYEINVTPP